MEKLKKIGIIGTQYTGKSTLIEDMKEMWPSLKSPDKPSDDFIKDNNLPQGQEGTKEAQEKILNYLVDEVMKDYGDDKMVFDGTIIDNLVHSLWLYDKEIGGVDEAFIDKTVNIIREAIKFYSIIFYVPFCEENDVVLHESNNTSVYVKYRSELGHIYEGIYKAWEKGGSRFFETDNCPAFIPVFGNRSERVAMMNLYINDKCEFFGEDSSLVADFVQKEMLEKQIKGE